MAKRLTCALAAATLALSACSDGTGPVRRDVAASSTSETTDTTAGSRDVRPIPAITGDAFDTGQAADLMLSGYGFGRTGGPSRFNHPGGVTVVDGRLAVVDRNNNRLLVWEGIPASGDEPPTLVLGQPDFDTNLPGEGLEGMRWPTGVASDGTRLYVADTYNDRVLVWEHLPEVSGSPADFALTGLAWPWGAWTDGSRLAVANTGASSVLVWDEPPTSDIAADLAIRIPEFGTPRSIGSDGERLVVSDHNARVDGGNGRGTFFWREFPTSPDEPYDFFVASPRPRPAPPPSSPSQPSPSSPSQPSPSQPQQPEQGEVLWGITFTPGGGLLAICGSALCVWDEFPGGSDDEPSVVVGGPAAPVSPAAGQPAQVGPTTTPGQPAQVGPTTVPGQGAPGRPTAVSGLQAGDASGAVLAGGTLVLSLSNANLAAVYEGVPDEADDAPGFTIGSPDLATNTLATDHLVTNPVPLTDGEVFYVASDFDGTLSVWHTLPTRSGAAPDDVYPLPFGPWGGTLAGGTLVLGGQRTIAVWEGPPDGGTPDRSYDGAIGEVALGEVRGVAYDGTWFAVSDRSAGRVTVWRGLPDPEDPVEPVARLTVEQPGRISIADGRLAVVGGGPGGAVLVYTLDGIDDRATPVQVAGRDTAVQVNLPEHALLAGGGLFVADTVFNRVLVWRELETALAGTPPDVVLGATDLTPARRPAITQDRLFWPGALAFDGSSLWVGEFKFSNRIVRFPA